MSPGARVTAMPATTRKLIIADRAESILRRREQVADCDADRWDVLCLGFQMPPAAAGGLSAVQAIDASIHAQKACALVRTFVLDLFDRLPDADLGGETLAGLLEHGGRNLWWYLEASEKSPFRDPLIHRLYHLALVRLVLEATPYEEVRLDVADASLAQAFRSGLHGLSAHGQRPAPAGRKSRGWSPLRYGWSVLRLFLYYLGARGASAVVGLPARNGGDLDAVFFTMYPQWWLSPWSGSASDRFFSAAPEGARTGFVAWMAQPLQLLRHRREVRQIAAAQRVIPLQAFLSPARAAGVLSPRLFLTVRRAARRFERLPDLTFAGFGVSSLVAECVGRSLCAPELFQNLMIEWAMSAFLRRCRPRAIAYRLEGQPLEHAILNAAGDTPTAGFMHSPFGENYLPMRFAPGEVEEHRSRRRGSRDRPLPAALLACGEAGVERLVRDGFARTAIAACGPQRHAAFLRYLAERPPRATIRARLGVADTDPLIFVAIAIIPQETEALFAALESALAGIGRYRLVVKPHPNRPEGDLPLREALSRLGTERAMPLPASLSMYDAITAADAVVCIGSTVAFEAMALGVMPVVFEPPLFYATTSLAHYDDSLWVVREAAGLRDALREIMVMSQLTRRKAERWRETVHSVLGDLQTPLPEQLGRALVQLEFLPVGARRARETEAHSNN